MPAAPTNRAALAGSWRRGGVRVASRLEGAYRAALERLLGHILNRIARLDHVGRPHAVLIRVRDLHRWRLRVRFVVTLVVGQLRVDRQVNWGNVEPTGKVAQRVATRFLTHARMRRVLGVTFGARYLDRRRQTLDQPDLVGLLSGYVGDVLR